jgi:acyl-CoA thioesterase
VTAAEDTRIDGAPPATVPAAATSVGPSAFQRQMAFAPDPAVPGRYTVDVDLRWNCPVVPQGGIMAALAAAAMEAELDVPGERLRSLTTVFAAQVPAGPVVVDVTVLRRGRTMSQATATVRAQDASAGHASVAVFGRDRGGFEFTDLAMPDVPGPLDCPSFRDPPPPEHADFFDDDRVFPFWEQVEGRAAIGRAPWDDETVPISSECAFWYRFDDPPMRPDGTLDPLAVVTLCDLMPSSVSQRMGPGQPEWYPPSADLSVHLLGEARSEWLLGHLHARRATEGYASVETALWDPTDRSLVAHAAQVMFLSFPDGPPVGDQRIPPDLRG